MKTCGSAYRAIEPTHRLRTDLLGRRSPPAVPWRAIIGRHSKPALKPRRHLHRQTRNQTLFPARLAALPPSTRNATSSTTELSTNNLPCPETPILVSEKSNIYLFHKAWAIDRGVGLEVFDWWGVLLFLNGMHVISTRCLCCSNNRLVLMLSIACNSWRSTAWIDCPGVIQPPESGFEQLLYLNRLVKVICFQAGQPDPGR